MSTYCHCCADDEAYVAGHLNWNVVDVYGAEEVSNFMAEDWTREARECRALWESNGEPLPMSEEVLADLLEKVYGL